MKYRFTYLINFEHTNEAKDNPWEDCFEWTYAQLLQVVANLWLVHLKKVFKQFAQTDDSLWVRTYGIQVTEVLAVHCSEDEVAVFFTVRDETERSEPRSKLLKWNDTVWWICSNNLIRTVRAYHWRMWLTLHEINDLSVSIEDH